MNYPQFDPHTESRLQILDLQIEALENQIAKADDPWTRNLLTVNRNARVRRRMSKIKHLIKERKAA